MRRIMVLFALVATAAPLGCSEKPTGQSIQGGSTQPKPVELPKARVRPGVLTAEDWKSVLDYPAPLRQGLSDEQLARDLELQAWAFDFTGGPLRCWLEFKESGQKTMKARIPAMDNWECDVAEGRIVFSVGRGASERMKRLMQKLGKDAYPESILFRMRVGNYRFMTSEGGEPLWFRWRGKETRFAVQESTIEQAVDGEELTLLRVEGVEAVPQQPDNPRKAVLVLKASLGKASQK